MVITLCDCDWGLGVSLPPHEHRTMQLIRWDHRDDMGDQWFPSTYFPPQRGMTVLDEVEELRLHVDWKALARAS